MSSTCIQPSKHPQFSSLVGEKFLWLPGLIFALLSETLALRCPLTMLRGKRAVQNPHVTQDINVDW